MVPITRLFRSDILALVVILVIHGIFFFGHYVGREIYPWDFTSSVSHGQAVAWFEDGGMLHPPKFLPYSSMGFPGWWAIQSGEWYLPLQVLRWLGVKYTFSVASVFQSFHVLIGAFGIYVLARLCRMSWRGSLIGALVFHFASIFYSNAEHVEFVRAAGLLPWLLAAVHPRVLCRARLTITIAAFVIQQYVIAAYAGDIVSGFYTAAALIAAWTFETRRHGIARRYLGRVCLAGTAGALMASVKWFIPASQMLGSFVGKPSVEAIRGSHLLTLLFRYGTPNLPGDLTMQSLWVPPIAILLVLLVPQLSRTLLIGLALTAGALVAGSLDSTAPSLRHVIPGLSFSRLAHSDWRVPLQIGLALASGAAVELVREGKMTGQGRPVVGARIAIVVVLSGMLAAIALGYELSSIALDGALAIAFLTLARLWISDLPAFRPIASGGMVALCAIFIVCTSYLQYVVYVPGTWLLPWSDRNEIALFGKTIADMIHRPRITAWPRRPMRESFGILDLQSKAGQIDIKLNEAYYEQRFTAFGYDNLGSPQYRIFLESYMSGPDREAVLAYVNHPSQVVISSAAEMPNVSDGAACAPEAESCIHGNVLASFAVRQYRLDGATYTVSASQPIRLMENEPFYPGFFARLCGVNGCQKLLPYPGSANLRVWTLPAGEWTMTVAYRAPLLTPSILGWVIGLAMALASGMPWSRLRGRARRHFAPHRDHLGPERSAISPT